jgi:predicted DNA-binding transcriptional regulator AlpA
MVPDNAMAEKDAARFLGVSTSYLAKRRVSGDGPQFVKYGSKRVVYLRSDLEAWRDARRRTTTAPDQQQPERIT